MAVTAGAGTGQAKVRSHDFHLGLPYGYRDSRIWVILCWELDRKWNSQDLNGHPYGMADAARTKPALTFLSF